MDKSRLACGIYCTKSAVGAVLVVFLQRWRIICTIPKPIGSKGRYLTKCPKPCRPIRSKEKGNLDLEHAANLIKPTQTRINRQKYTFCVIKSLEHLKNVQNCPRPLFRPGTDHTCHQIQIKIHLVKQSL